MLTKKKQAFSGALLVALVLVAVNSGCRPSGAEALLDGKRSLDRGQPAVAVRQLREATSQMPTNSLAWGYLGLAYQQGGSPAEAAEAYARALLLSPELAEVRFNLGCLWMDQRKWAQACEQFEAATVLQKNSALTWQRLGEAQARLGEYDSAVRSLGESLRINSRSPDAWNWLGLAQLRQGRTQEAARSFQSALRLQTNHGPALLNLAILNQTKLNKPATALELYRQYLAFLPDAPNAAEVRRLSTQLEAGLDAEAQAPVVAIQAEKMTATKEPIQPTPLTSRPVVRADRSTPSGPMVQPAGASRTPKVVKEEPVEEPAVETVIVTPAPAIAVAPPSPPSAKTVPGSKSRGVATTIADPPSESSSERIQSAPAGSPRKRGFFAKINPVNLFKKKPKDKQPTPLPSRTGSRAEEALQTPAGATGQDQRSSSERVASLDEIDGADRFKRYPYRLGAPPTEGSQQGAIRAFDKGEKLRKRGKSSEALESYLSAVQEDPSHFAAQFNLGLLYLEEGGLSSALRAFEAATTIRPNSAAARYNFALTLKMAGYPVDAGNELLTLLSLDPQDTRAHLTLGNLYAQQFRDRGKARVEYHRVLELDPGHPQASSIHLWLVQNPL